MYSAFLISHNIYSVKKAEAELEWRNKQNLIAQAKHGTWIVWELKSVKINA